MHMLGRHQGDPAVAMLFVIPQEVLAESSAVLDGTEPLWELRTVIEGPELRCRVRAVINDMRATVGYQEKSSVSSMCNKVNKCVD
jgi:hypothetical protein